MHLIPTVIEKDKNHQYAYDIYSKLLEERIILLTGTIDDAMASSIIGQLLYLEAHKNARRDFELNEIEQDMIRKHMFPLNPVPPKYRESWILCMADKICASKETVKRH